MLATPTPVMTTPTPATAPGTAATTSAWSSTMGLTSATVTAGARSHLRGASRPASSSLLYAAMLTALPNPVSSLSGAVVPNALIEVWTTVLCPLTDASASFACAMVAHPVIHARGSRAWF